MLSILSPLNHPDDGAFSMRTAKQQQLEVAARAVQEQVEYERHLRALRKTAKEQERKSALFQDLKEIYNVLPAPEDWTPPIRAKSEPPAHPSHLQKPFSTLVPPRKRRVRSLPLAFDPDPRTDELRQFRKSQSWQKKIEHWGAFLWNVWDRLEITTPLYTQALLQAQRLRKVLSFFWRLGCVVIVQPLGRSFARCISAPFAYLTTILGWLMTLVLLAVIIFMSLYFLVGSNPAQLVFWVLTTLWSVVSGLRSVVLFALQNASGLSLLSPATYPPAFTVDSGLLREFGQVHGHEAWDGVVGMALDLDKIGTDLRTGRDSVNTVKLVMAYLPLPQEAEEFVPTLDKVEKLLTSYADDLATYSTTIITVYTQINNVIKHTQSRLLNIAKQSRFSSEFTNATKVLEEYLFHLDECIDFLNAPIELTDNMVKVAAQLSSSIQISINLQGYIDRAAIKTWESDYQEYQERLNSYKSFQGQPWWQVWLASWFQTIPEKPPEFSTPQPKTIDDLTNLKTRLLQAQSDSRKARDLLVMRRAEFMNLRDAIKGGRLGQRALDITLHVDQLEGIMAAYGKRATLIRQLEAANRAQLPVLSGDVAITEPLDSEVPVVVAKQDWGGNESRSFIAMVVIFAQWLGTFFL